MSIGITPLADYVVARQEEVSNKTASGLYLPEKTQEKPKIAKVEAVGQDVKHLRIGDRIIYKSYSPTEVKHGGIDYILVREEDVMATVA